MEEQKIFILDFLKKEAECWTKSELNDLEDFNECVRQLYAMGTQDMDEAFGIFEETELDSESNPKTYSPAHLFKLSSYKNLKYQFVWVAYISYNNPVFDPNNTSIDRGVIIANIDNQLKIIGLMSVALRDSDLSPVGWKKSMYNPKNLNIHDLGEFVSTERYHEPIDDGFSLQDYLEDK